MANILLVDPDGIAQRAMKGILARGNHRFAAVDSVPQALSFLRTNTKIDLLIVELRVKEEGGLVLVQRLKSDFFLKSLPVVVYPAKCSREVVKSVLSYKVQNLLLKPYREDSIFDEVSKAKKSAWRKQFFKDESLLCEEFEIDTEAVRERREQLSDALSKVVEPVKKWGKSRNSKAVFEAIKLLVPLSAKAGVLGVTQFLKAIHARVLDDNWSEFDRISEQVEFAVQLMYHELNPKVIPDGFLTSEELNREIEARALALWATAPAEHRCPMVGEDELKNQLDKLSDFPVIDSIAAAFQMAANGSPTSLNPLMELVHKDPSLTAQMLVASNRFKKKDADSDDSSMIEESKAAVSLLGEIRLVAIGGNLLTVEERRLMVPPFGSWPKFRMFQLGTARMAEFACQYLEMPTLEPFAYTAGLLHDIGKMILLRLHPPAFQAIQDYAVEFNMKLSAAERVFLGTTTAEMGAYFAEKQGLPKRFVNVMRWMNDPFEAKEDEELVALVSLARGLCRLNNVGFCGDTTKDVVPIGDSEEWRILRNRVYLNFDLAKFEMLANQECRSIKHELQGQLMK